MESTMRVFATKTEEEKEVAVKTKNDGLAPDQKTDTPDG